MRFNDEQLSAILSAHEALELLNYGYPARDKPCMMQVAYADSTQVFHGSHPAWEIPCIRQHVFWFDAKYDPSWTSEEFLRRLEERGLA